MKQKVLILYGGQSTEHEVSCRSAATIIKNLDPEHYDVMAIGITQSGQWLPQDVKRLRGESSKTLPIHTPQVASAQIAQSAINPVTSLTHLSGAGSAANIVVFPIIHGTHGEDGTLQGLLEMANLAFVGPDTLGSAVGMDKGVAKKLCQAAGLPVAPFVEYRAESWARARKNAVEEVSSVMKYPVFVKPSRLGSSVGISKVRNAQELIVACEKALQFDDKILVEQGLDVREIEFAALGGYDPEISVPGEVVPSAEFYTYEAKYLDEKGAEVIVPARNLTPEQVREGQVLSKKIFKALDLYGMARIDLFLEKKTGKYFFNEVNTIPGFTDISQYPMLWRASGIDTPQLMTKLIDLALERKKTKDQLQRQRI
jgi:D-alanine-D-alanine ligase